MVNGCDSNVYEKDMKAERKRVAELLKQGYPVVVEAASTKLTDPRTSDTNETRLYVDPNTKLSGFYWYERNPDLYADEVETMKHYFPDFKSCTLSDGRKAWTGNLRPNGETGGVWNIMAVYEHNHPNNSTYGGSVKIYSITPDLDELDSVIGPLPHVLTDDEGCHYMCTSRIGDTKVGAKSASAATHLANASKWIKLVEDWMEGIVGDEIFQEVY